MRIRLLAVISLLFLCGVATAQSYSIRVAFNTNLRAAASLQASISETAPAGSDLNVIGEADRWLQINRNGATVWMASWVRHERIEGSQQTGSQQQVSNVDNCCFVDRQCTTDQEWTDGYWAFQNGQCTAPVTEQTSSQPLSVDTGQTDNCCFVDRHCVTDQEWVNGYHAFRENQCVSPVETSPATASRPRIEGSPAFVSWIEAALNRLESKSSEWYTYVINNLDAIREVPDTNGPRTCRAGALAGERTTIVETDCRSLVGPSSIAGVLAHEACHIFHHEQGITYPEGHLREEWECGKPHTAVAKALLGTQSRHMPWEEFYAWMTSRDS